MLRNKQTETGQLPRCFFSEFSQTERYENNWWANFLDFRRDNCRKKLSAFMPTLEGIQIWRRRKTFRYQWYLLISASAIVPPMLEDLKCTEWSMDLVGVHYQNMAIFTPPKHSTFSNFESQNSYSVVTEIWQKFPSIQKIDRSSPEQGNVLPVFWSFFPVID